MGSTRSVRAGASGWHTFVPDDHPAARLFRAEAVRERCARVMDAASRGATDHFRWNGDALPAAADFVAAVVRERYLDLRVPYHSRWRHFEAGGVDRFGELVRTAGLARAEAARARIDLVIPSVLLDAGAGGAWRYRDDAYGMTLARSEGLGVASLAMFAGGEWSALAHAPLRADAAALAAMTPAAIASAFQVTPDNPLIGVEGRAALLRRLGEVAAATPAVFGAHARLGSLFDYLAARADDGRLPAALLLATLLRALGPVWPSRLVLAGVRLGDCWQHDAACRDPSDPTDGLVPLHKLTQWLAYSLVEPLAEGGIEVTDLDALTGLPEYRNGGLLLDTGVLVPRRRSLTELGASPLPVDSPAVVEWRALTVIALDRLADEVRARLGLDAAAFPLARVLEGGTWHAGRRIAAERRPDGRPPLDVESDGTVF